MMKVPKIAVGVCMRDAPPSGFVQDYGGLMATTALAFEGNAELGVNTAQGTYIHINRNNLAKAAVREGYDYLFCLDDDMRFPPDALVRLLQRMKGNVSIVGANYGRRVVPYTPTAIKQLVTTGDGHHYSEEDATGLTPVDAVGFGCVLISTKVFHHLPFPWFQNIWDPKFEVAPGVEPWIGEDVYFCRAAKAQGYQTYVDEDLSREVRHIGRQEITLEHSRAALELMNGNDVCDVADGDSGLVESVGSDESDSNLHPASRS